MKVEEDVDIIAMAKAVREDELEGGEVGKDAKASQEKKESKDTKKDDTQMSFI